MWKSCNPAYMNKVNIASPGAEIVRRLGVDLEAGQGGHRLLAAGGGGRGQGCQAVHQRVKLVREVQQNILPRNNM